MSWLRWLGINVALFAAIAVLSSYGAYFVDVLVLGNPADPLDVALAPFTAALFVGPLFLVGLAVYLPILTLIPHSWTPVARRLAAVVLSPIVGALLLFISPLNPGIVAYALVPSVVFGLLVRLVEPAREGRPEAM